MSLALRISIGYFLVGASYLTISDLWLAYYHNSEIGPVVTAGILKGCIFFFTTAVILFFILKKYIRKLQDKRHLLNTVVNNTHDWLWLIDSNFKILLANSTFSRTFENQPGEALINKNALSLASGDAARDLWKSLYQQALNGEKVHYEAEVPDSEGDLAFVAFDLFPVTDSKGKVNMVACFGHDITDLKKVQREIINQNLALKEITWIQAHEMRRPVVNIKGLVAALDIDQPENPENRQLLKHIVEQADDLDVIIHKVVEKTGKFR